MIFCVEDDSSALGLMIYTLHAAGYDAKGFGSGQELFATLLTERPQLILLDIMLPGEDGIAILKKLKAKRETAEIPVIMASAKGTEYDKVRGLDLGADDYLAKPFGMMEMISRVRAVLRRTESKQLSKLLRIGDMEINTGEHTVFAEGERIQLTLKEYELLKKFMENPGMVFIREQLFKISGETCISAKQGLWMFILLPCGRNWGTAEIILKRCGV